MIARYTSSIAIGTAVTFGLFYLMQTLIAMQPAAIGEARIRGTLDFIRIKADETTNNILPPIDYSIDPPPVTPPRGNPDIGDETGIRVASLQAPTPEHHSTRITFRMSDGPLVAMIRVKPGYPAKAAAQGLQGHVVVQFDVLADGTVANPVTVESSHRIFERSALQAAAKFRYKPRVVDGIQLATTGVRYLFRFEMDH